MHKPLIIGIVGGIGSGKSTLAAKLRASGYSVYDSDAEARIIQNEDKVVRDKIIALFGADVYENEKLNRKKVANIVFRIPEMLKKLTEIVHPAVISHFNSFANQHKNDEFIFLESAVLFESGLNKLVDMLILVTASERERIIRVVARDNVSENDVIRRMKNQIKEVEIYPYADLIINTEFEEINIDNIINNIKALKTKKGTR